MAKDLTKDLTGLNKMLSFEINFPSLQDIIADTDPKMHEDVFRNTANDLFSRALPKTLTQIKKKFNIDVKKESQYSFVFASKSGVKRKRSGRVRFASATKADNTIKIYIKGESIDDYLFDASYASEAMRSRSQKRKSMLIKRAKKDKRPRVKILKTGRAKVLTGATFYARMASGHFGIFRRKGKKIIEMRTITPTSMFRQVDYESIFSKHYNDNFTKRYAHYYKRSSRRGIWG